MPLRQALENPDNLYKKGEKKGEIKPAVYNKLMDPLQRSYEASKLFQNTKPSFQEEHRFDFSRYAAVCP